MTRNYTTLTDATMAGGYGRDIGTTVAVHQTTWRVALAYWRRWQNRGGSTHPAPQDHE